MCCSSARSQRHIIENCLKWINQRKAFGKPLANQPVVRAKIASMISRAEAIQAWLENITYQMCNMVRSPSIPRRVNWRVYFHGGSVVVQTTGQQTCRSNRLAEVLLDEVRSANRSGCRPDFRWTWYYSIRDGC